jgi:hypothetical protein
MIYHKNIENVTMYPQYNNNIMKKRRKERGREREINK